VSGTNASYCIFAAGGTGTNIHNRAGGLTVRCIKE
jgi:hypothetical protein